VDIGIWRPDQLALRTYLTARGWTPEKAINGQRLPWPENEFINLPIHAISCKNPSAQPSRIEVLFNEASNGYFRFRRDLSITMPLADAIIHAKAGVSILAPEIVLLYKAKDLTREDNQRDFETVLPHLNPTRRAWLQAALLRMHPGHEWLGRL